MNETPGDDEILVESLIAHLSDEFMEGLKRGESLSVEDYIERHPQCAHVAPVHALSRRGFARDDGSPGR